MQQPGEPQPEFAPRDGGRGEIARQRDVDARTGHGPFGIGARRRLVIGAPPQPPSGDLPRPRELNYRGGVACRTARSATRSARSRPPCQAVATSRSSRFAALQAARLAPDMLRAEPLAISAGAAAVVRTLHIQSPAACALTISS